ncbi:MAG: hypothetical protein QG635_712 [Bacteroidota bacterium]|nr:hypothetical protein [Bacteroidota bacterium]
MIMKDKYSDERRDFLKKMFTVVVASAVFPHIVLGKIEPEIREKDDKLLGIFHVDINDYPKLREIWGSYRISIPNTDGFFPNVLLTRLSREEFDEEFACVSESCPHEGNPVEDLNPESLLFECKKGHGSLFMADGTYVWGKADKKNLEKYKLNWDGKDSITIDIPAYMVNAVEQENGLFYLSQNEPNPCSSITRIQFGIEKSGSVKIVLLDLQGRELLKIANGFYNTGNFTVPVDVSELAPGAYFYKMTLNDKVIRTKKLIVAK